MNGGPLNKKVFIRTFGCQMNEHDSGKMEALLRREGYGRAVHAEEADLVVINTCSIREKSYQKAVSEIGRRLKGRRAGSLLAVTGCVAAHDGENLLKRFPFVNVVLGPDHIASLPGLVREAAATGASVARTGFLDLSDYEFPAPLTGGETERRVTAYVTVMKGCDNRCSFCIVPFVRGGEVSRPPDEILREIRGLEGEGVREVMLLGQNVNSYGKKGTGLSFARLLRIIDKKCGIARLRFTSPHPKDLSLELIEEYGRNGKLCPHIHLPAQSGSNRVLKRMRRSYTREVFLRKVERIRRVVPEIAITTDIIVGFPGETEGDFGETLSLVREVGFDASYSFAFSARPGTEAASFPDDLPPEVKKERLARFQELQDSLSLARNRSRIGRVEPVLIVGPSREGQGQMTGRTPHGRVVNFDGDLSRTGAILDIEITAASPYALKGTRVNVGGAP